MAHRLRGRIIAAAVWAAITTIAGSIISEPCARAAPSRRIAAAVPARATPDRLVAHAAAGEHLAMSVVLQLQHTDELAALLEALQNPSSPLYHHWLTPQQFTDRFAPTADAYETVATWLEQAGLTVWRHSSRSRIDFSGDVATVET